MTDIPIAASRGHWRDYLEVSKPRVVALMLFTVVVGMFLAAPGMVPWSILIFGLLGIAMVAGAAAAINHLVDQRVDAIMNRTRRRPLPRGALSGYQVLGYAMVMGGVGLTVLAVFANSLCAMLTFASLVGYAGIYSMYLKHATPHNIVIGGAAGAAPPLLGWVAVTGHVDWGALSLFLIIFTWTPPHFWALAIHRREDYAMADIPMLPVTHGVQFTSLQILIYSVILFVVALLPVAIGMSGRIYLVVALVAGAKLMWYAWRLYHIQDVRLAMPMFKYSITYLSVLFAALLIDHCLKAF